MFFNQLANLGALSGLAAMLPSDAFAEVKRTLLGETPATGIQIQTADGITRTYLFHAHAHSVGADAGHQASVHLPEEGGFRSQFAENYRSPDGVSFRSAYMHVAGTRSSKPGYGWVSLATSFVTGLNIQDVVTADLVFAEVSTEHPLIGHVPAVTFLGTRFQNLRIAGRPVEPVLDLSICGTRSHGDTPYVQDAGFLSRVARHYERINVSPGVPDSLRQQYHWDSAATLQQGKVECSLVTSVDNAASASSYGHIVGVPGFGNISLAHLEVSRAFHLTMVSVDTGQNGTLNAADVTTNGHHYP
jgi:hypothetical protein